MSDPRDVLLRAALGRAMPTDVRDVANIPEAVLAPISHEVAKWLSTHNHPNCRHAPRQLRHLQGWRERQIAERKLGEIHSFLVANPNHALVQDACARFLGDRQPLVELVASDGEPSGDVFARIRQLAEAGDNEGLIELAAALWTSVEAHPENELGFLLICGIVNTQRQMLSQPAQAEGVERGGGDARSQKKLERLSRQLDEATSQVNDLKQKLSQATAPTTALERARRAAESALADAQRQLSTVPELQQALEEARARVDEAGAALKQSKKDLKIATDTVINLRRRVDQLEKRLVQAEKAEAEASADRDRLRDQLRHQRTRHAQEVTKLQERLAALEEQHGRVEDPLEEVFLRLNEEKERLEFEQEAGQGARSRQAAPRLKIIHDVRSKLIDYRPGLQTLARRAAHIRRGPLAFTALGGGTEIGASAYLVEIAGKRILIDCGIRPGADSLAKLPPAAIQGLGRLDAVVVTHAHADHIGWLPAVAQVGQFEILLSLQTEQLMEIMLEDAQTRMKILYEEERTRALAGLGEDVRLPYSDDDRLMLFHRTRPLTFGEPFVLADGSVQITLFSAGHILGASSVLIEGDNRAVFLTGDFSEFEQLTVGPANWDVIPSHVDLLVMEATYGSRTHVARDEETERLSAEAARIIEDGDGTVLLPCFAVGRAQEVIAALAMGMDAGRIPRFPVYIDGLIRKVNETYRRNNALITGDTFVEVASYEHRREIVSRARREPCAIVSTSGMIQGGPMVEYAAELLQYRNNRLFICGYQDEESPGRRLLNMANPGWTGDRFVDVRRDNGTRTRIQVAVPPVSFGLSAHADQAELLRAAEVVEPRHTALVHGDAESRRVLGDALVDKRFAVTDTIVGFELGR